jgi:hypothetical protein
MPGCKSLAGHFSKMALIEGPDLADVHIQPSRTESTQAGKKTVLICVHLCLNFT